jgi:hypothetical protein
MLFVDKKYDVLDRIFDKHRTFFIFIFKRIKQKKISLLSTSQISRWFLIISTEKEKRNPLFTVNRIIRPLNFDSDRFLQQMESFVLILFPEHLFIYKEKKIQKTLFVCPCSNILNNSTT